MMQRGCSFTLLGFAIAVQLLTTGCLGLGGGSGGGGTGGAFNSGSGSGSSSFADSGSGSGGSGFGGPIHNPEPASAALFGVGLVGFGAWRRRKTQKPS